MVTMFPYMMICLGCFLGEPLMLVSEGWVIFNNDGSSNLPLGGDRPGFPTTWKKGPEISNIQLVKFTKSACFPCDHHTQWVLEIPNPETIFFD